MKVLIEDLLITDELDREVMSSVRGGRTVNMFLRKVWRDGALFGLTPVESLGGDQPETPA